MKRSGGSGISISYPEVCISKEKKISLDFLVKTKSKSLPCLQFVIQAFGVKGVEMCPHSSLTALELAPIGVGGVR